jgi:diguanylate cyclase (GGDEF)-like protein
MHGGAPSLSHEYIDAIDGIEVGPDVGSCGASSFSGERVLVENIETDSKWANIKHLALPHGMRCCWPEPIKNSHDEVLGAFGMYYDYPALPDDEELKDLKSASRIAGIVMEWDHNQQRIYDLAFTDELTGLANRVHFYQYLDALIKSPGRHKRQFILLYIDLDDFKTVNDNLGHDAGDTLLKNISNSLKAVCRDIDFVARLSGDEFCILAEDINDEFAAKVAQRCLDAISQPIEVANRKLTPACSIGIAHFPDDGNCLSALVKAADISLYAAKENGKNQYTFYNLEMAQKAEHRIQVEQFLRSVIENNELSLVYQPQVDTTTGKIFGVEALARWKHPLLGDISPIEFIAIAEKIGLIKPLTEWVLNTACRQAVTWLKAGLPPIQMAVNISPIQFLDKDIVSLIKRTVSETGIDPAKLELEVTEGAIQTDQQNLSILKDLKEQGIQLAIDDFGTGYSSFASLKHLTVDCLKIDKYFVDDLFGDKDARTLVASMIDIGQKLSHSIIAEGIESEEQLTIIKDMGCKMMQGYLFSKPVDAASITALMSSQTIH